MVNGIQGASTFNVQTMTDMREKMFARLDPDGNGQIDLADLQAKAQQAGETDSHFSRMLEDLTAADTDGDGIVSRDEFEQMAPPPPPPPQSSEMRQELFDALDFDEDGQINLAELLSKAEEAGATDSRFLELLEQLTAADADGDGIVTRDEFEQMELPKRAQSNSDNMGGQLYTRDSSVVDTSSQIGMLVDELK